MLKDLIQLKNVKLFYCKRSHMMSESDSVCTQTAFIVNVGANVLFREQAGFHLPPQADFQTT